MMPALGGGSTLRGFQSWRFRDRHTLLLSAEWRTIVNRYLDVALFADAGTVGRTVDDLTTGALESDYGIGFRFHGPITTPLRIEVAHSREQWKLVVAAKASF
jgi:outer membrane protein assembly factor BamA